MAAGSQIAIGRSADIIELPDEGRVLKLFHSDYSAEEVRREFTNTSEAFELGATTMRCYEFVEQADRCGLIFDRLTGPSLTKLPDTKPLMFFELPVILGRLHASMHEKKTDRLRSVKDVVLDMVDSDPLAFLSQTQKEAARRYVKALPEGSSLLHMDYHPENIIVTPEGPVVIDWMTALRGDPAADVAYTSLISVEAELWPGTPQIKVFLYSFIRKYVLNKYRKTYQEITGMSDGAIDAWRLAALMLRMGQWNVQSERPRLQKMLLAALSAKMQES